jgi:hypothetical protein
MKKYKKKHNLRDLIVFNCLFIKLIKLSEQHFTGLIGFMSQNYPLRHT